GTCAPCPRGSSCDGTAYFTCIRNYVPDSSGTCVPVPICVVYPGERAYFIESDGSGCRPPSGWRVKIGNIGVDAYKLSDTSKLGPTFGWKGIQSYVGTVSMEYWVRALPGMVTKLSNGQWEAMAPNPVKDRYWWYNTVIFDVLPMTNEYRWMDAANGDIPNGCIPIFAGYDENNAPLHHALRDTPSGPVLGMAGKSLGGAAFTPPDHFDSEDSFLKSTLPIGSGYRILCWNF
ncbi:hypothetical protein OIO90_006613, partial [Microbotryomycetes sp. JL221]